MKTLLALATLTLPSCVPDGSCGSAVGGKDPGLDPVERLDTWSGPTFSEVGDLEVVDDVIWMCSGVQGLHAWDATNPASITKLDDLVFEAGDQRYPRCDHLAVHGDQVFVTHRGDSISESAYVITVDATDPRNLVESSTLFPDYSPEGITVHNGQVLVAGHDRGLVIYDLSMTEITRVPMDNAWQVRAVDDIAWVADATAGLVAVDLAVTPPKVVGQSDVPGGAAKDLVIDGDLAYVAAAAAGLAVFDIADPTAPSLLTTAQTPGSALGVAISDDAVFVSDWNDLRIFDRSNAENPSMVAHEPLPLMAGAQSRSLGIAATGNVIASGNWTELVTYRYHPDRSAPDLTASPLTLDLSAGPQLVNVTNVGTELLKINKVTTRGKGLTVDFQDHRRLEPGEQGRITVTLDNPDRFGGWFNLVSNDPDQPRRCVVVQANAPGIGVGDAITDDHTWVDLQGNLIRLSDHKGKAVLLAYFATF